MNRCANQDGYQGTEYKKFKFYKHLKTYLWFIGVMVFLQLFLRVNVDFYGIAFWWGFAVIVHYLRTFGWEGLKEQSGQHQAQDRPYESFSEPEVEEFVELKQPQRSWRDRDLV